MKFEKIRKPFGSGIITSVCAVIIIIVMIITAITIIVLYLFHIGYGRYIFRMYVTYTFLACGALV